MYRSKCQRTEQIQQASFSSASEKRRISAVYMTNKHFFSISAPITCVIFRLVLRFSDVIQSVIRVDTHNARSGRRRNGGDATGVR